MPSSIPASTSSLVVQSSHSRVLDARRGAELVEQGPTGEGDEEAEVEEMTTLDEYLLLKVHAAGGRLRRGQRVDDDLLHELFQTPTPAPGTTKGQYSASGRSTSRRAVWMTRKRRTTIFFTTLSAGLGRFTNQPTFLPRRWLKNVEGKRKRVSEDGGAPSQTELKRSRLPAEVLPVTQEPHRPAAADTGRGLLFGSSRAVKRKASFTDVFGPCDDPRSRTRSPKKARIAYRERGKCLRFAVDPASPRPRTPLRRRDAGLFSPPPLSTSPLVGSLMSLVLGSPPRTTMTSLHSMITIPDEHAFHREPFDPHASLPISPPPRRCLFVQSPHGSRGAFPLHSEPRLSTPHTPLTDVEIVVPPLSDCQLPDLTFGPSSADSFLASLLHHHSSPRPPIRLAVTNTDNVTAEYHNNHHHYTRSLSISTVPFPKSEFSFECTPPPSSPPHSPSQHSLVTYSLHQPHYLSTLSPSLRPNNPTPAAAASSRFLSSDSHTVQYDDRMDIPQRPRNPTPTAARLHDARTPDSPISFGTSHVPISFYRHANEDVQSMDERSPWDDCQPIALDNEIKSLAGQGREAKHRRVALRWSRWVPFLLRL